MEKNHVNLFRLRVGQGDTDFTVLCHECQELRATSMCHRIGVEILQIRKRIQTWQQDYKICSAVDSLSLSRDLLVGCT